MDGLDKTDLKILINRRNITIDRFGNPLTAGTINSLNLASLREHLVMVTDAEIDFLGKLKEKRVEFSKVKLDELKRKCLLELNVALNYDCSLSKELNTLISKSKKFVDLSLNVSCLNGPLTDIRNNFVQNSLSK
jgi:hypothetical protein